MKKMQTKHTECYKTFHRNIPKKLKLRLKNTIIDKTLTYASETWILTKRDRKQIFLKGKCIEEF
jgi:hypothetical protein